MLKYISVTNYRLLTEEAVEEAVRNCELVNRRELEEEDTVTLEELAKQRVEALNLVEKERKIVEQERAVYESIADKISKRHTSHHTGLLLGPGKTRNAEYGITEYRNKSGRVRWALLIKNQLVNRPFPVRAFI